MYSYQGTKGVIIRAVVPVVFHARTAATHTLVKLVYIFPPKIQYRAGASGPAGQVLAGPILREKVGVFISRLHVGVAARSIVTQRCTKCKQLQRNAWGTVILGQADVPAVWNLR